MPSNDTPSVSQVFTIPNLISLVRLLLIPYLFILLTEQKYGFAAGLISIMAFSDFVDGFLARKLGQESNLGEILDPLADRLMIVSVVIAYLQIELLPMWLVFMIFMRDLFLLASLPKLISLKKLKVPVEYLGKLATFVLLAAFSLIMLGTVINNTVVYEFAFAGVIWGGLLYWAAGLNYFKTIRDLKL